MDKKKSSSKDDKNKYILEELQQLQEKFNSLQVRNSKLMDIIRDNELEDELDGISEVSIEESICVNGLQHLSILFENGTFDSDSVKSFDTLHKNYRLLKGMGEEKKRKPTKPADIRELMKIVKEVT